MGRARIPTEKMLAFADYIIGLGEVLINNGYSPLGGEFTPHPEDNLFGNFNYYFQQFFDKTEFTEQELGRFLYEIISLIAGESEYGKVLLSLGRDDFVSLVVNTIYCYKLITNFMTVSAVTTREARTMQGVAYSLGRNYLNTLNKIGFDGVEKLLGIAFDTNKPYQHLTPDEKDAFIPFANKLEGKVATFLYIIGESLTNIEASAFEELISYTTDKDDLTQNKKLTLINSQIKISRAISTGIEKSFVFYTYNKMQNRQSFISEYVDLFVQYTKLINILIESDEEIDYVILHQKAIDDLSHLLDCLDTLRNVDDLHSLDIQQIDNLFEIATNMYSIFGGIDNLIQNTFSIALVNFVIRIIDIDKIIDANRNLIEDMLPSIIGG